MSDDILREVLFILEEDDWESETNMRATTYIRQHLGLPLAKSDMYTDYAPGKLKEARERIEEYRISRKAKETS